MRINIHDKDEMIVQAYNMYFADGECEYYKEMGFLNQKITVDFVKQNIMGEEDWEYLDVRYAESESAESKLAKAAKKIMTNWQNGIAPFKTYSTAFNRLNKRKAR